MKRKFRVAKLKGGGADAGGKKSPGKGTYKSPVSAYTPGPGDTGGQGGNTDISTNTNVNRRPNKSGNIPIIGPITAGINIVQKLLTPSSKAYSKSYNPGAGGVVTHKTLKKPPMPPMGGDNNRPQLCPDGTTPPCITKTTATTPTKPTNTFLKNFKAYNSGGVSSGPPPLRGPNPQVPPVKMRNGKMTNKYKMSCPHRPDGIRGMGAAIKGHKFIGVK